MSELKWNWAYYPYLDTPEKQAESALKAGYIKVVNKDDADKVIADKDEKIDELEEHIDELQKATDSAWSKVNAMYDELRHNKRKRCLTMARLCGKTVDHLNSEGYIYEKESHTKELTDCIRGTEFYDKWYHRWLALAEEPTWAKFLQLIHKEAK